MLPGLLVLIAAFWLLPLPAALAHPDQQQAGQQGNPSAQSEQEREHEHPHH
jgi:hypothetical protein